MPDWREVAESKRAHRDALLRPWSLPPDRLPPGDMLDVVSFPTTCGHLSPNELEITETTAVDLVDRIRTRRLTSVQATKAFCKRAALAQQLVNCLTEVMFEKALEQAKRLDELLDRGGEPVGPMHGLPMSIKDNFQLEGFDSTVGFPAWANQPMTEESELVKILRKAGAVIFVKTNISTAMMMAETYNNVWGRTLSPYNRNQTCGGSSGGEGALLALKGSPLGVGTDIGGSIRIPSALNYLYGLKPSLGRFPTYGARSGMAGQEAVPSTNGPMSSSLSALTLYASTVCSPASAPWLHDPKALPLPWRHDVTIPPKLCVGVLYDSGVVRPQPPVLRALRERVAKLRSAGHTVIDWAPTDHDVFEALIVRLFLADGGETISKTIAASGEDWPAGLAAYNGTSKTLSGWEYWQLHLDRTAAVKRYLERWNESVEQTGTGRPMDAILMPATPFAGVAHDQFRHVGYTCIWNICDCPAAIFPALRADRHLDPFDPTYQPRNEDDAHVHNQYDPALNHGSPVALQLVARKLEEEKLLKMVEVVSGL